MGVSIWHRYMSSDIPLRSTCFSLSLATNKIAFPSYMGGREKFTEGELIIGF